MDCHFHVKETSAMKQPDPEKLQRMISAGHSLCGVDLRGADLQDFDLRGANFESADLSGANLSGADLFETILTGVSFRGACLQRVS